MKIRLRFVVRRDLAGQSASRLFESGFVRGQKTSGYIDLAALSAAVFLPFRLAPPAGRLTTRLAPRAFATWVPLRYAAGLLHRSASDVVLHNLSLERTAFGVRSLSRCAARS
jgi:hypothetical protein